MAVYVDDMRAPFGRLIMCHMLADSDEELLRMADAIGVSRRWHQYPGTVKSHFDIALSKRALAVSAGAKEITTRETGLIMRRRRSASQEIPVSEKKAPLIALTPVTSSRLNAMGYDPETQTLALQFKNKGGVGATYHYSNFTETEWAALKDADSQGSYVTRNVIPHKDRYPFSRVAEPPAE